MSPFNVEEIMKLDFKSNTLSTGLAMFSMFFGAGNVVFPLALGQYAQNYNHFAIFGLLLTAVGVPFMGLIAMTLFDGDYKKFFERLGKYPGLLVAIIIMALIGPFGAIPRCIALSYSTVKIYLPEVSVTVFSLLSCLTIFAFTAKKNRILEILGWVLTPILLGSLGIIIVKGLLITPETQSTADHVPLEIFWKGFKDGYQTMDLLGAFFFSSVILACLKQELEPSSKSDYRAIINVALKASAIGAFLLSIVYIGFSYVSAFHSNTLGEIAKDQLAGIIAIQVLGPYAGIVACVAVAIACLTTAIALAAVFAEFIHIDVTQNKLGYIPSLIITLIITFFVSTLEFDGIVRVILPILQILYPALIVLTLCNIAYKLWGFKPVKVPVLLTFLVSLAAYFY